MNRLYYYILNGKQQGPFTLEELLQQNITLDTPIWTEGMTDWRKAVEVPEVAQLLPPQPIPTPSYTPPFQESANTINNTYGPKCPPTYLIWAVLMTVFCCWPIGIFAIINAAGVESAFRRGNLEEANKKSKRALNLCIIGAISGVIITILYIIYVIFFSIWFKVFD